MLKTTVRWGLLTLFFPVIVAGWAFEFVADCFRWGRSMSVAHNEALGRWINS